MFKLILLSIYLISSTAKPSLISAKQYYKENLTILGDTYTVGIFDLQFNESLYEYHVYGSDKCFNDNSCRPSNIQCDPCDWTDPLICNGTIRGPDTPCPCGVNGVKPLLCSPSKFTFPYRYWPSDSNNITLELYNGAFIDVIFHPKPPNNCSCIIFNYDFSEGGYSSAVLLYYGELWAGGDGVYEFSRFGACTICPSNPRWGQTQVIRVVSLKSTYAKVKITIEYRDIPQTAYSSKCDVPTSLISTHQCLATNIPLTLSPLIGESSIRVVIDIPTSFGLSAGVNNLCSVVAIWASSLEYLISTDPWISPENSTGAYRSHKIGSDDGRLYPSVYPFCLKPGEKLYMFVLSSSSTNFFIDITKEWMYLRSFNDIGAFDFYKKFFSAVAINCQNKTFIANRDTYEATETMDTGSINLRMIYPSDDIDIFSPPPVLANDLQYSIGDIQLSPITPGRIIVSLLLNQRLIPRSQPLVWNKPWFSNSYQWLKTDEWNKCTLDIKGKIASNNGEELWLTITEKDITSGLPQCDPHLYTIASNNIDSIQNQTAYLSKIDTDIASVYKLWFLQDRITASNDFYSCRKNIQEYYNTEHISTSTVVNTDRCIASFDTNDFNTDPCCGLNKTSLYDQCLISERILGDQYKINEYTNLINNCSVTECTEASLTNLLLQFNSHMDPTACTNSVDRPTDQYVYWRCVLKLLGPEPISFAGINCTHDIDCVNYPKSICDLYSKRCFVNISQTETDLISCIYDGFTQFSRTFVSNSLGLNPADPNIKELWLSKFSETLPCSDDRNPIGFPVNVGTNGRCHGCNGYVYGETPVISTWSLSPGTSWANGGRDCWAPGSTTCTVTQISLPASSYCSVLACNIMPYENKTFFPYISAPSYCSNATICGVSDDGFFNIDVTNVINISNCGGSIICILANGTKVQTINSSACKAIYSCDVDCIGPGNTKIPCSDEESCLESGICSDATDYDIGIWTGYYKGISAACFFEIRYKEPFNPTVSICNPPFRNTILGCSYRFVNQSDCISGNFNWGDPDIFELINLRWITKANTQTDCAAYGTVCEDPYHPKVAALPTHTNTLSFSGSYDPPLGFSPGKCTNTGHIRDLFYWRSGRWLSGQPRTPHVVVGAIKPRFSNTPRIGLNLPKILSNITKAVDKLQSLKIQSSAFCRTVYKHSLDQLVCSCITGYNESYCYGDTTSNNDSISKQKQENTTSIGVLCDEASIISVEDLQIITTEKSLPTAICDVVNVVASSIVIYRSRTVTILRTLLVNYEEDSEFAIRNQKLAIYGKVLTNGYAFNFDTVITNITMCINLSVLRTNYRTQLDKYPVLDLAKRPADSMPDDLIPLNLEINFDSNQTNLTTGFAEIFCANLDILEKNQIYYFIQKTTKNYVDVERTVFTMGEIIYISILLALYSIGLIAVVCRIIHVYYMHFTTEIASREFPYRHAYVLFLIGSFFIFRIVLFSLLLNNSLLGLSSTRAVNYVLFEFPIVLYFAFVTSYVCIWVMAIMYVDNITVNWSKKRRIALLLYFFVNFVILILFVIMVILFELIIDPPYLACDGSILLFDSNRSYSLLLSYRIIFSSIALVVGITLFIVAIKIGNLLGNPELNIPWYGRIKIYLVSVVGGLGLIGQAIYFLIITATQSTPNNYASLTILLILEIIPSLLFVFIENVERTGKKSTGISFTSKKKSSSGNSVVNSADKTTGDSRLEPATENSGKN